MPYLIINTYVSIMYELKKKLERYLAVNLLGPVPCLIKKKNLPGRGLTKVEKHWCMGSQALISSIGVLSSGSAMLCYMLYAQLYILFWHLSHRHLQ